MTKPHRLVCDSECYRNYYLLKFKSMVSGKVQSFELYPGSDPLNVETIKAILRSFQTITFNGNGYDIPLLMVALTGADNETLKRVSDNIIVGGMKPWHVYELYGLREPKWIDHIDLIEVAFGQGSLKLYGGRLHSKKLQDLPIEPDAWISPEQRVVLSEYCENDLDTTADLATHLESPLELRAQMSEMYGVDLRSKSDAQIAEAVIRKEVSQVLGTPVYKPTIPPGTSFRYVPPAFLRFKTQQMKLRLAEIAASDFVVDKNGSPEEPKALAGMVVAIGAGRYRMGIGGLHSSETNVAHRAGNGIVLMDADVTSYYPSIILGCELFPAHLTKAFLKVYRSIFDRRVAAKKAGDKTVNEVLKIVLNGSFGKFGSKYSALYSPHLMIQVTVTGQLALLMLIESLHLDGIECVSANTDGIVLKFHESRMDDVRRHIADWSAATGFGMEETFYKALYSRDVNNYIAVKDKGVKGKGQYAEPSISKNPENAIVNEAVKAYLEHGTPVEKTIRECQDIRKFVTVQRVTGGATYCGTYLGKVVRWYIGQGRTAPILRKKPNAKGTNAKVPCSDGAAPCMNLPSVFPTDVAYGYYINEAYRTLRDIGAINAG